MHFTTTTGAILALTATLASSTPITKESTAKTIDPSKPFQITAVGATSASHVAVFNLYSYFSNYANGQDVPATLRLIGSGSGQPSNFTFSDSQLSVYGPEDGAGPCTNCAADIPYGNVPITVGDYLQFRGGPFAAGLAFKDNHIIGEGDKDFTQFGMCPQGKEFVLKYMPTDSNCTPVSLNAHFPGSD